MLFSFIRGLFLILVLAVVAAVLLGGWGRDWLRGETPAVSTPTREEAAERAREIGEQVGERAGTVATTAGQALADGSVTAKIKAKLALDDHVRARDIDIDTAGTTVTVSGTVRTADERERVLRLARETDGVTEVVDRLRVAP